MVWAASVYGQSDQTRPLSLEESISLALKHNLDVRIEQYLPEISEYSLSLAYSGYDPTFRFSTRRSYFSRPGLVDPITNLPNPPNDTYTESFGPELSGLTPIGMGYSLTGGLNRSRGTSFGAGQQFTSDAGITISQPLLRNMWIDNTRWNIKVSKNDLKISELGLMQQVMNTVTQVELAYADLVFARENVKVQEKAMELADRLLAENKKRVEVGAMAPLDEKQAQSQVAVSRANLLSARQTLKARQNALKGLLTEEYTDWYEIEIEPTGGLTAVAQAFSRVDSWTKGTMLRPDLRQLRLDLENRNITVSYRKNQLFPSLDLTASFGATGRANNHGDAIEEVRSSDFTSYSIGAIFSIPLSNLGPRKQYRISKAQREQAILRLKRLEQNALIEIDDAIVNAQTAFERVQATREARLYADAALEAEQKKLESGKSTSFFVLQLQRDLTSARSQEIQAVADYNKALAQLALSEGSTLENWNIVIDVED